MNRRLARSKPCQVCGAVRSGLRITRMTRDVTAGTLPPLLRGLYVCHICLHWYRFENPEKTQIYSEVEDLKDEILWSADSDFER